MTRTALAFGLFSTVAFLSSAAGAQPSGTRGPQRPCEEFGLSSVQVADGQTYYRTASGWSLLTDISSLSVAGRGVLQMVYIVKPDSTQPRSGVVVIKSGRVPALNAASSQNVKLVRQTVVQDGVCKAPKTFVDADLPSEIYDGYHDYGRTYYSKAALQTLDDFHVQFGPNCRRTDHDPGGVGRHVSNRASFSYTLDVVDNGGYTGVEATLAKVHLGRAARAQTLQAANPFGDRRTEIKQYASVRGAACMQLDVPVSNQGSFLRINDLGAPILYGQREHRF
jgi:hypothetical protein